MENLMLFINAGNHAADLSELLMQKLLAAFTIIFLILFLKGASEVEHKKTLVK